jgi:hypothetical protein
MGHPGKTKLGLKGLALLLLLYPEPASYHRCKISGDSKNKENEDNQNQKFFMRIGKVILAERITEIMN